MDKLFLQINQYLTADCPFILSFCVSNDLMYKMCKWIKDQLSHFGLME